jgi:gamma-glutamylaminecyclotransferase
MANSHLVFVYGSLQRGEHNHGLLHAAEYRGEARSERQFRLYAFRHYPALVRDENDPRAIVGEVYAVDEATLRILDRLEDNGQLYQRELIDVDSLERPNERLRAWVYIFRGDLEGASPWPDERWRGSSGESDD